MEDLSLAKRLEAVRKKVEDYEEKGFYDEAFENDWKLMLDELNKIKVQIYKQNVFSSNEDFSEVAPENIKFFLVAYYQAETIQKFKINRKNLLEFAIKFYKEFYNLLKEYNFLSKNQIKNFEFIFKKKENNQKPDLNMFSIDRQRKIEMYKYKKNLSEKLKKIEKEDEYENNKEFWTEYLNLCIVKMYENINTISQEIQLIEFGEKMKKDNNSNNNNSSVNNNKEPKKKMDILRINSPEDLLNLDPNNKLVQNLNFISTVDDPNIPQYFQMINGVHTLDSEIVKQLPDNMRKEVFKNSNPTTMTIDEFAEMQCQRMKEHHEKEEEHKKEKSDDDSDHEEVADKKTKKAREWDDWKDAHPKGSGNRMGQNY